jgi:hypothetical protein
MSDEAHGSSPPTAASHHDLSMVGDENGWQCQALIEV